MGACTATVDPDGFSYVDASGGYMVRCKITPSSSYAAGGDTIAASIIGLTQIQKLSFSGTSDGGSGVTTSYIAAPVYDSSNWNVTNVQVFQSAAASNPFTEASGNLSTITFDAVAWGF